MILLVAGFIAGLLAGGYLVYQAARRRPRLGAKAQPAEEVHPEAFLTPMPALRSEPHEISSDIYRDIVENVDTDIAVFDSRGRYRYVNAKAVKSAEVRQWLIGKTNVEYAEWRGKPVEIARTRDELIASVIRRGREEIFTEDLVNADGETRHFLRKISPIIADDGMVRGAVGFGFDITDRTRAESSLHTMEMSYGLLVENSPLGVFRLGRERKGIFVNPALVKMLGYDSAAELLAIDPRTVWSHPEDREKLFRSFTGGSSRVQTDWTRKDGKVITVRINAISVTDESGRLMYWEGFVEDITPLVEAERALRASEQQLRQSQKLEAIGRLAGGIAHDFNNLLTVIRVHNEFRASGTGSPAEQQEDSTEIARAVSRAELLTRQLLAFGRKQMLQPKVIDMNSALGENLSMLRRLISENVGLVTSFAPDVWPVRADPGQISQVIVNLVVNARDAMPSGGMLRIETDNVSIGEEEMSERGVAERDFVRVRIADDGAGMDAETLSRLFEPFFTTKELGKGSGLGLSTVYGIIRQSGGFITVESAVGEGSRFDIFLPRLRDHAPSRETGEFRVPGAPRGSETILLVEDEMEVRRITARILTENGYRVLEAAHGAAAIEIAQTSGDPIDLLVTDVMMPGVGGRELVEELSAILPPFPTLFMSGYAKEGTPEAAAAGGATRFLQKPFGSATLLQMVRESLDSAAAR